MKKYLGGFFIVLVVVSLTLMFMGRINPLVFWIIAALAAFVAWFVMPRIK